MNRQFPSEGLVSGHTDTYSPTLKIILRDLKQGGAMRNEFLENKDLFVFFGSDYRGKNMQLSDLDITLSKSHSDL